MPLADVSPGRYNNNHNSNVSPQAAATEKDEPVRDYGKGKMAQSSMTRLYSDKVNLAVDRENGPEILQDDDREGYGGDIYDHGEFDLDSGDITVGTVDSETVVR